MQDFLLIIKSFLENSWDVITTVKFPGTDLRIAVVMFGSAAVILGFNILSAISGLSFSNGQKGGNNQNIKVSNERKDDNL